MKLPVYALIAACLASGHAAAADVTIDPQRFEGGSYDWSGFYAGASLAATKAQDDDPRLAFLNGGVPLHSEGENDNWGFHVGAMHQFGSYVLGVEYEYRYLDLQYSESNIGPLPVWLNNTHAGYVRAGIAVDRIQFYGLIGTRWADTNVKLDDYVIAWGGGVDVAVTQNVIMGLRYDRSDFEDFDSTGIDGDLEQLSARISLKF